MTDRKTVLSDDALAWFDRGLWALCIGVYLAVFVGGILARGDELEVMGRAFGLTIMTAVLGKIGLGLLARASLPEEEGPSDEQDGPIGSRDELVASANVAQHEDGAQPA